MDKPKKWYEVYPYGTKAGNEEALIFRALSRNPKYDWRSTAALIKTTGLSRERVEEIIDEYATKISPPLIYAHPTNADHWGYWENCTDVLKKDDRSISKKDQDNRVDKQMTGSSLIDLSGFDDPNADHEALALSLLGQTWQAAIGI